MGASTPNWTRDMGAARRILPRMSDEHHRGPSSHHGGRPGDRPDRTCPAGDPVIPAPASRLHGLSLGIDVGGTGVKAALVDLATAELVGPRFRERTPQPSTPEAVADDHRVGGRQGARRAGTCPDTLPVGCGLPGIVKDGRLASAANIDQRWIGWPATDNIGAAIGRPVLIINDADAAGMAELAYGAAEGRIGHRAAADPRHRHRQRPVHRWTPGAQHRVRSPGVPRPGRRDAHQRRRAGASQAGLEGAGRASSTSTSPGSSCYFSPDLHHLRRGRQQGVAQVGPHGQDPGRGRDRQVPEHVGHHRRGVGRSGRGRRRTSIVTGRVDPRCVRRGRGIRRAQLPTTLPRARADPGVQLHLLDATYELFRAHFGRPPHAGADGQPVGATVGVVESTLSLLREDGVTHLGAATDHVIRSWRNDRYAGLQDRGRDAARAAGPVPAGGDGAGGHRGRAVADGRVRGGRRPRGGGRPLGGGSGAWSGWSSCRPTRTWPSASARTAGW